MNDNDNHTVQYMTSGPHLLIIEEVRCSTSEQRVHQSTTLRAFQEENTRVILMSCACNAVPVLRLERLERLHAEHEDRRNSERKLVERVGAGDAQLLLVLVSLVVR